MSDEGGGDVLVLRPYQDMQDDERMLAMVPRSELGRCPHFQMAFSLDARTQRAYCRECEEEVPLFEVLEALAREGERFIGQRKEAKRRRDVVLGQLEVVERAERNAKARLRKAVGKLESCACGAAWSGFGSAYWRFCPMCGGTRPSEAVEAREADREAMGRALGELGARGALDALAALVAVPVAERWRERWRGELGDLVGQSEAWVQTRIVDALSEALPRDGR